MKGFWFDGCREKVFLVLIPTGILVCLTRLLSAGFFRKMEKKPAVETQLPLV